MARYIYQQAKWPEFHWDEARLVALLANVRFKQGKLLESMEGLEFSLKTEASLQSLTQKVLKSSEIEGELLNAGQGTFIYRQAFRNRGSRACAF